VRRQVPHAATLEECAVGRLRGGQAAARQRARIAAQGGAGQASVRRAARPRPASVAARAPRPEARHSQAHCNVARLAARLVRHQFDRRARAGAPVGRHAHALARFPRRVAASLLRRSGRTQRRPHVEQAVAGRGHSPQPRRSRRAGVDGRRRHLVVVVVVVVGGGGDGSSCCGGHCGRRVVWHHCAGDKEAKVAQDRRRSGGGGAWCRGGGVIVVVGRDGNGRGAVAVLLDDRRVCAQDAEAVSRQEERRQRRQSTGRQAPAARVRHGRGDFSLLLARGDARVVPRAPTLDVGHEEGADPAHSRLQPRQRQRARSDALKAHFEEGTRRRRRRRRRAARRKRRRRSGGAGARRGRHRDCRDDRQRRADAQDARAGR
jgi:hypothetical protein